MVVVVAVEVEGALTRNSPSSKKAYHIIISKNESEKRECRVRTTDKKCFMEGC